MTIPFDPPRLLTAKRHIGFVDVPPDLIDKPIDFQPALKEPLERKSSDSGAVPSPTSLKRSQTMTGSIIVIEDNEGDKPNQAYWLARKVEQNVHGVTRVGYKLRPNTREELKSSNGTWELDIDESCVHPLVTIKIVHTKILLNNANSSENNMMSFLQMIGRDKSKDKHVDGTNTVATCADHVYIVLPYHRDGSLDTYCRLHGHLKEPVARFLFLQILQGMKTLQRNGLCHRDLSPDTISLDGDYLSITESRFPVRCTASGGESRQTPPTPAGSHVQYIAPEYFRGNEGAWNGYAADLWACGLILYGMVIGTDALFLAPVDDDRTFVKLCLKGQIRSLAQTYGELIGETIELSDDLVDLLRKMLKVDPKDRLTLDKVLEHPWMTIGEFISPSEWGDREKRKGSHS